jgi:hypothetical protein
MLDACVAASIFRSTFLEDRRRPHRFGKKCARSRGLIASVADTPKLPTGSGSISVDVIANRVEGDPMGRLARG